MSALYNVLRDRRGYSLMELVTVMVVISVLSSLAVPSIERYVTRNRARRALDGLSADLAYVRLLAARDGRVYRVRASSDDRYVLERLTTAGQAVTVKQVVLANDFPGTRFALPQGGFQLEYTSRGLVRNLASELFIKVVNRNARDSIFVSPAGRVYRGG